MQDTVTWAVLPILNNAFTNCAPPLRPQRDHHMSLIRSMIGFKEKNIVNEQCTIILLLSDCNMQNEVPMNIMEMMTMEIIQYLYNILNCYIISWYIKLEFFPWFTNGTDSKILSDCLRLSTVNITTAPYFQLSTSHIFNVSWHSMKW